MSSGWPGESPVGGRAPGQEGVADQAPVVVRGLQNTPGVEQVARGAPIDQGDRLAAHNLVQIEHWNSGDGGAARPRADAEQRFAGHVVEIDLKAAGVAQRRAEARHPFAAGVLGRLSGHLVALGREDRVQGRLDGGRSASMPSRDSEPI